MSVRRHRSSAKTDVDPTGVQSRVACTYTLSCGARWRTWRGNDVFNPVHRIIINEAFSFSVTTVHYIYYILYVLCRPGACRVYIYIYIYLMFSSLARLSPVKSKTQKSIIYILYLLLTVYYIYIMYLRIPIILCGRLRLTLLQAVPSAAAAAAAPAAAAAAAAADAVAR